MLVAPDWPLRRTTPSLALPPRLCLLARCLLGPACCGPKPPRIHLCTLLLLLQLAPLERRPLARHHPPSRWSRFAPSTASPCRASCAESPQHDAGRPSQTSPARGCGGAGGGAGIRVQRRMLGAGTGRRGRHPAVALCSGARAGAPRQGGWVGGRAGSKGTSRYAAGTRERSRPVAPPPHPTNRSPGRRCRATPPPTTMWCSVARLRGAPLTRGRCWRWRPAWAPAPPPGPRWISSPWPPPATIAWQSWRGLQPPT